MPARYDSPTQTGSFDDCDDDEWYDYHSGTEDEDNSRGQWGDSTDFNDYGPPSRPYTPNDPRLYSPSRVLSRGSSTLSFTVLGSESRSGSPLPDGDMFEPVTPSNGLELPTALPSLHEWYGQPLYSILNPPPEVVDAVPAAQSVDAAPAVQSVDTVLSAQPDYVVPILQSEPDVRSSEARQPALELSQFFDEEAARLFNELLHQPNQPEATEESESDGPEERFIVRDEEMDLNAIRDRSVMDIRFVHEMPVLEPEVPLASAPQAGYTPPEEFEPPYNHPLYDPPANDGRMPHAVDALTYLCAALQIDDYQLQWTLLYRPLECFNHLIGMSVYCEATRRYSSICHMTALTPESHVSVTGTKYTDYLRGQCNYTVPAEHKDFSLVELADRFLAPLDSLIVYYHV